MSKFQVSSFKYSCTIHDKNFIQFSEQFSKRVASSHESDVKSQGRAHLTKDDDNEVQISSTRELDLVTHRFLTQESLNLKEEKRSKVLFEDKQWIMTNIHTWLLKTRSWKILTLHPS